MPCAAGERGVNVADIVLVPGTTQSSAGYAALAASLRRLGHRPLCVDLPVTPLDTATEYAEQLARQLPHGLHDVVVVAHSAAGLLLPALAMRLHAVRQVWLAAV